MKQLLTLFTLSLVIVACETQPVGVDTPDVQFAKNGDKGKPDKGPKPASGELITFTGDLSSVQQEVEGCCPNAGPFPAYTMTLSEAFPSEISGGHTGNIFMNSFGRKTERGYKVQFWWGAEPDDCYCIEIGGGETEYDKRTKILTVTFTDKTMTVIDPGGTSTYVERVTFTLTREPIR